MMSTRDTLNNIWYIVDQRLNELKAINAVRFEVWGSDINTIQKLRKHIQDSLNSVQGIVHIETYESMVNSPNPSRHVLIENDMFITHMGFWSNTFDIEIESVSGAENFVYGAPFDSVDEVLPYIDKVISLFTREKVDTPQ